MTTSGDAMSLFGDSRYQWRETYFVLFRQSDRPLASQVVQELKRDHGRFEVSNVRKDRHGRLESLTLKCPDDFSAVDISYVSGEEVSEQVEELVRDISRGTLTEEEREKMQLVTRCDARFDIFHFEQVPPEDEEGDDFLDPAALLTVIERLSQLCHGVGIDPQSGSLM